MGLFGSQVSSVVEWKEYADDIIMWKFSGSEIKKGSKLIIRPGQDAIFMSNGRVEGIFTDEGSFDIESQIIPFLTTLKSFTFGFNTPMRAEVIFINTREFTVKWGTRNAIILQAEGLPGGIPIRAYGTFNFKVSDATTLIDKVAGVKNRYTVDDVKERVLTVLNSLLMKWIATEGKNIFNLQANAYAIGKGIQQDLDYEMSKDGITITGFSIQSVSYPEEVAKMQNTAAAQSMIGNLNTYMQFQAAEAMGNSQSAASQMAGTMAGMQTGMYMGSQIAQSMQNQNQQSNSSWQAGAEPPKFCPNCGKETNGSRFCGNCGYQLIK